MEDLEAIWLYLLILQMRKWGPEVWNQFPYCCLSWLGTEPEETASVSDITILLTFPEAVMLTLKFKLPHVFAGIYSIGKITRV